MRFYEQLTFPKLTITCMVASLSLYAISELGNSYISFYLFRQLTMGRCRHKYGCLQYYPETVDIQSAVLHDANGALHYEI